VDAKTTGTLHKIAVAGLKVKQIIIVLRGSWKIDFPQPIEPR
jgi:hypothetical protein